MKAIATLAALALVLVGMGTPLGRRAPEAAAAFVRAYNAWDTRALAELFTDDAEIINEYGRTIQGREAIAAQFASAFDANPGERIEIHDQSIRFLGPDIAREDERARILPPSAPAELITGSSKPPVVAVGLHVSRYVTATPPQRHRYTLL